MTKPKIVVLGAALLMALPTSAFAWGPRAERAIITTAAQVISRENNVPLNRLLGYVREGASASPERVEALVPGANQGLQRAIESEIFLLQAVKGDRIDPYLAYRLGVLGKLVAEFTSPLEGSEASLEEAYNQDADKAIGGITLSTSPRREVDPGVFLPEARQRAQSRRNLIVQDYETGVGFQGVARGSLSQEASASVDTVADVWHTILSTGPAVGGVSQDQIRQYYLDALRYYLTEHVNAKEAQTAYDRILESGDLSVNVRKQIGDLYYDAGRFDRAMEEYRWVLEQEPGRDDVVGRMAEYYIGVGDRARQAMNLEAALEAYRQAQEANPVSADAQARRRETEDLIAARDARLEQARRDIAEAQALQQRSEQLEVQRNFGGAMDALQQARALYAAVPDEFMAESQEASRNLTAIDVKLRQLQTQLVQNTGQLSGSGFPVEARRLVAGKVQGVENQALQQILQEGFQTAIEDYSRRMESSLLNTIPPR